MANMIYGTAWKEENTESLVELALKSGFRAVDTACQPRHYREDLVGRGLKKAFDSGIKRDEVFIQTKFTPIKGQDLNNMPYLESDDIITQLEKSFSKSKENLGVDFIDSYLIHSPFAPIEDMLRVYKKMEEFYDLGEVGQLGISNCYDLNLFIYLYDSARIKPEVIQNRFYRDSDYDKELRAFAKQKGITYQSFWSLTANPHILSSSVLENLAKKYEKTVEQIFYRFLNHLEITPLNGTTSQIHMLEDLDIVDFSLSEVEIKKIEGLL